MKKFLPFLLVLSLLGNVLLVAQRLGRRHELPLVSPSPSVSVDQTHIPPFAPGIWRDLATGNADAFSELRSAGLPQNLIGAFAREAVENQFRDRERASYRKVSYWENNYTGTPFVPGSRSAVLDVQREKRARLQQLAPGAASSVSDLMIHGIDFLPFEKRDYLQRLREDFAALRADTAQNSPTATPATSATALLSRNAELAFLEKSEREELAQVLTPAELIDYDLRFSPIADRLRRDLDVFEPTEQEFRQLMTLPAPTLNTPFLLTAKIRELFGETRAEDYTRSTDNEYRAFAGLARNHHLPREKAIEAYTFQKQLEDKLHALRHAPGASARIDEINANAFREAEIAFVRILGRDAFETARRDIFFLRSLKRP